MINAKLIMFREDGSRREFVLHPGATTVGRKDDCTIRIPLATVSRRHCEFFVDEDAVSVKDLGAANGTFLNNRRVTEEELEAGDQVVIGPVVFTVQINGEPGDGEIVQIRTKLASAKASAGSGAARIGTSKNVVMSGDEVDPISALEALASSADQTAIHPEDDEK